MAATKTLVTPDDLLRMPDGKGYELIDGELKEIDVSFQSSFVAGEIFGVLRDFVKPRQLGYVAPEGTSYRCFSDSTKVRRADASFIRITKLSAGEALTEGHCSIAPDLVIEVVSPNDLADEVEEKVNDWASAEVALIWVIYPKQQKVRVFPAGTPAYELHAKDTLTAELLLPGFKCAVADLFWMPGQSAA